MSEPRGIESVKHVRAKAQLPALCEDYLELNTEITAITAAKKIIMEDISNLARSAQVKKVVGPGWSLSREVRMSLSKTRLVELGVEPETISNATVAGKPFYVVRRMKEGD